MTPTAGQEQHTAGTGGLRRTVFTTSRAAEFLERRATAMTRLMFAHIGNAEAGGRDLPVGEFAGCPRRSRLNGVAAAVPDVRHLPDLRAAPEQRISVQQHYRQRLDDWYGLRAHVTEALTVDRHLSWRDLAAEDAAETVAGHRDQLRSRLVDLLAETRPGRGDLR